MIVIKYLEPSWRCLSSKTLIALLLFIFAFGGGLSTLAHQPTLLILTQILFCLYPDPRFRHSFFQLLFPYLNDLVVIENSTFAAFASHEYLTLISTCIPSPCWIPFAQFLLK